MDGQSEAQKRLAAMFGLGVPAPDDDQKRTIGFMGARVASLEEQVQALTIAVVVLLNSKDKRSAARIPATLQYRKPRLTIDYGEESNGKTVATIRIELGT